MSGNCCRCLHPVNLVTSAWHKAVAIRYHGSVCMMDKALRGGLMGKFAFGGIKVFLNYGVL